MELDLYPRRHPQALGLLVAGMGARSPFFKKHGFYVDCVTPDLAAFPDGWTERLIPFSTRRTGGVTGWCVEPHDVAASKLAAAREKDLNYVRALLVAKLIKPIVLEDRILTLPINPNRRQETIELVKRLIREARSEQRTTRKK